MLTLEEGSTILFTGDSITDCGRNREVHDALGNGYPLMTSAMLGAMYPEMGFKFLNRGISGNRAADLKGRWQEDCIDLKPDVVSIMIGINDTWRRYDSDDPTTAEQYEANYRFILEETKNKLGSQIVIIEPFVLPFPEDRLAWRKDLDPKIAVARKLAAEFADVFVPLDGIMASAAVKSGNPAYWSPDGVHPSPSGHMLIADSWLNYTGLA